MAQAVRTPATWGLDRIGQRNRPLDGAYRYDRTGAGVNAYVIDTGIRASHTDFGGRVTAGATAIGDGRGSADCNGHGTHVAGTVGGATHGVAKSVTLVPVRVLDCTGNGSLSGVIAGVDWVTQTHSKPAVANMSLGGGIDRARQRGAQLDLGRRHLRGRRGQRGRQRLQRLAGATNTISGTSMASPHVAGVGALYLHGSAGVERGVHRTATGAPFRVPTVDVRPARPMRTGTDLPSFVLRRPVRAPRT